MINIINKARIVLCLMTSIWCGVSTASERAQVDLIIFENLNKYDEETRRYLGTTDKTSYVNINSLEDLELYDVLVLDDDKNSLKDVIGKLLSSNNYKILEAISWEQPFYLEQKPLSIRIFPESVDSKTFTNFDAFISIKPNHQESKVHASVDIIAQAKEDDSLAKIAATKVFPINQVYYFDHPDLGVLLKVRPFESVDELEVAEELDLVADVSVTDS